MTDPTAEFDPGVVGLVAEVADDFRARRARGEDPDPEDYAARHPQAASAIRGVLAVLRLVAPSGPAAGPPAPASAPVAGVLGDFRIGREIGRGGMGVVYEAEQISLSRRVALKVLPFAALADPRLLQRFRNEARAAAALDHPHVVKVHAVGEDRGVHFIAMQFVDGRPLSEWLRAAGGADPIAPTAVDPPGPAPAAGPTAPAGRLSTLPDAPAVGRYRRAAEIGVQAAEALEHAHALGVVHRDIKPGNLLIDARGDVWVSDFGLAKVAAADAGVTLTGDVFGTLRYMSPEQALAKHDLVDHRADVYALGATLYELLAGHPAVDGADRAAILRQITDSEPIPLRRWDRSIPADLETVAHKCLRKEPNERYASARELADDLRRFLNGEPVKAKPVGPVGRWLRWAARRPLPVLLVGLTTLAVGAAVALGVLSHYRAAADRAALQAAAEREERKAVELQAAGEAVERQRFFTQLEQVRQHRADPYPGWSRENLKVLRELAALPPAAEYLHDLRSEAAAALSALDLVPAGVLGSDFAVGSLDYSPNGKILAAGRWAPAPDDPTRVRLYDAATGEVVGEDLVIPADPVSARWEEKVGMQDRVSAIRFSPNGEWLVGGTGSGKLAVWDTRHLDAGPRVWVAHAGDPPANPDVPGAFDGSARGLVFTPDGQTLRSGSVSVIRTWGLDGTPGGPPVLGYQLPGQLPPMDRRTVGSCRYHGDIEMIVLGTGEPIPGTRRRGDLPVAVAPGGRLLAYMPSRTRGPPVLQAVEAGATARTLWSHTGATVETPDIEDLAFDAAGGLLVSVETSPPRIKLWDVAAGRLAAEQTAPFDIVHAAFRPDSRRLSVAGRKGVALFDLPNRVMDTVGVVAEPAVEAMAASLDQSDVWVIGRDLGGPRVPGRVYRQALGPGGSPVPNEVLEVPAHRGVLPFAEWWPTGRTAVFTHNGTRPPDLISPAVGPPWDISANRKLKAIKCGPDGRFWMVDEDSLLEVHPGRPIKPGPRHFIWQNDPEWAPKGLQVRSLTAGRRWVFIGRRDGMVIRVDPATGSATEWPLLATPADGLAVSPDESRLLVGGEGGEVRLVDVDTAAVTVVPDAHRADVPAVAFGRHFFVTGSADRRVRLWTPDGRPLATLRMQGPVKKVLLSDDERSLLVLVEGERAVRRWRLDDLFQEWRALGLGGDLPPV